MICLFVLFVCAELIEEAGQREPDATAGIHVEYVAATNSIIQ